MLIPDGAGSGVDAVKIRHDVWLPGGSFRAEDRNWGALTLGYWEGDASARATEPVGGVPVGVVYYAPSETGSAGINFGPTGGRFRIDRQTRFIAASYRLPWNLYRSEKEDCETAITPVLSWSRLRERYASSFESIALPGVWTEARQRVDNDWYGIGVEARHARRLSDSDIAHVLAAVDLLSHHAELKSGQWNACWTAGCPPGSTFTALNSDKVSEVGWSIGLAGGIEHALGANSSIGMEAGYRYLGRYAALINPARTIDLDGPPHLKRKSASHWRVGVSYRYTFR